MNTHSIEDVAGGEGPTNNIQSNVSQNSANESTKISGEPVQTIEMQGVLGG